MAGFLYFIPGAAGASREQLEAASLWTVLGGESVLVGHVDNGPQGPGALLALDRPGRPGLGYRPATQKWIKPDSRTSYLGWEISAPPGPADLARLEQLAGHEVLLEDGNKWLVPVARIFPTGFAPEVKLRLGPGGKWVAGETAGRLADLAADAEKLWQEWMAALDAQTKGGEQAAGTLTLSMEADMAVRALAANYRLGAEELDALELLTNTNVAKIGLALVDWPSVEAATQKKTRGGDGLTSTSGGAGSSPATSPPLPTSTG